MTKHFLARQNDLKDGDMKAVEVGGTEVLLTRTEGRVSALYARCTHYGAPLSEGVLSGARIVCPWHHACFSARTGELLEPPALDDLPQFEVTLGGDEIWVELPDDVPETASPAPVNLDETDARVFVIVGAGAAGAAAAETLRRDGFRGRVVLVGREGLPYDRTLLSKDYLSSEKTMGWIPLRGESFYDALGVALLTQTVTQIDPAAQQLTFEDGDTLHYDALLLATGSVPKPLTVPGAELGGVFYLRTLQDSQDLVAAAQEDARALIIGASFIGMECAASLRERGLEVTVVTPDEVPFEGLFGREVGEMFRKLHEANGVAFVSGTKVAQLSGEDRVTHAVLEDGRDLPADLVVIGVGVGPKVPEIVGVALNNDGSVSVDRFLRLTGNYGPVYAAGDLARYPDPFTGEAVRVEHWRLAMQHGRAAAHSMAGQEDAFTGVPLFWTKQHGVGLRYVGHAESWDEVVIDGDLGAHEFLAYYLNKGKLRAVLGAQRDAELCVIEERFRLGTLPPVEDIRAHKVAWLA